MVLFWPKRFWVWPQVWLAGLELLGSAPVQRAALLAVLLLEYWAKPELAAPVWQLALRVLRAVLWEPREVLWALLVLRAALRVPLHGQGRKDHGRSALVHEILQFAGASFFSFAKPGGSS